MVPTASSAWHHVRIIDVRRRAWEGGKEGRGGVFASCMVVVEWPKTLASLQCRDNAGRVFTDQADIACNKREAPGRGVVLMSCMALVLAP